MTILEAIERSISHTEIAHVEYDGDAPSLLETLRALYTHDVDHAVENDGRIDVWGNHRGDEFRLSVALTS